MVLRMLGVRAICDGPSCKNATVGATKQNVIGQRWELIERRKQDTLAFCSTACRVQHGQAALSQTTLPLDNGVRGDVTPENIATLRDGLPRAADDAEGDEDEDGEEEDADAGEDDGEEEIDEDAVRAELDALAALRGVTA